MAFDPSKPYEVVEDKPAGKKGFDPSKPFERADAAPKKEGPDMVESAMRGAVQGGSLGFSDEIVGGVRGMYDDLKSLFGKGGSSDPAPEFDELGRVSNADKLQGNYKQYRDQERALNKAAQEANPLTYLAGNVAGGLAVPGAGSLGGATAAGALAGVGASDDEDVSGIALDALIGGGLGAGAYGVGTVLQKGINKFGQAAGKQAEDLAETATGATRVQAEKFRDGAGRELLDRGLVKFGDTPEKIAERAALAKEAAGKQIGDALSQADELGAKVDVTKILSDLIDEVDATKGNIGMDARNKALMRRIERIMEEGQDYIPASLAEDTKRALDRSVNWNTSAAKPNTTAAIKEVAGKYRSGVEEALEKASPELASSFKEGKNTFGLLAPIEEAATKRAIQLNQNPLGGFNDMTTGALGTVASGNPIVGAASAAARRLLAPRAAATGAVSLDYLSKLINSPAVESLGKYAKALKAAAGRSMGEALVTHNILRETDPEYRAKLEEIANQ